VFLSEATNFARKVRQSSEGGTEFKGEREGRRGEIESGRHGEEVFLIKGLIGVDGTNVYVCCDIKNMHSIDRQCIIGVGSGRNPSLFGPITNFLMDKAFASLSRFSGAAAIGLIGVNQCLYNVSSLELE